MTDTHTSTLHASNLASYGDFTFDPDARTLRGLLIPFGEKSRTASTGQTGVEFSAETIDLPRDPSVIGLNREHNRYDPVGRATELTKTERGVEATFTLADTDEADTWLSRQKDNLRKLSAEVMFAADGVRARLTGAALVTEGAFATAGLFALSEDAPLDAPADDAEDTEHLAVSADVLPEDVTVTTPEGDTETYTPADPAEENPSIESEGDFMSSIVPSAPGAVSPASNDTAAALFSAVATRNSNPEALTPFANAGALFAISNIQDNGPSGRTIGADTQIPQAVQELWSRRPYDRKYTGLINNATLTSTRVTGWRFTQEPTVADYAGNLAEVHSNIVDTEPVVVDAARIAGGHKLDRRFYDFGDTEVIASYFRKQTEAYARFSDGKALTAITSNATVTAPGLVPSGANQGLAAIVDGALGVIGTDNTPTFALVSPELWRDIVLTNDKNNVLAYLDAGFGLEEGSVAGFKILPANVGTGTVIVGAKEALTFYELGGGAPIRVEGLDVHHGGVDVAVFGYYAVMPENVAAIRSVTVATGV